MRMQHVNKIEINKNNTKYAVVKELNRAYINWKYSILKEN